MHLNNASGRRERILGFAAGPNTSPLYQQKKTIPRNTNLLRAEMVQKTWVDKKNGRIHTSTRMQTPQEHLEDLQKILCFGSGALK